MQLEFSDAMKKEFQRLHSLEWQLFDNLKMLAGVAQNPELKQALERHREETGVHLQRLEQIGARLGFPVIGLPNLPMKALSVELLEDWGGAEPGPVTDAMIIGAPKRVSIWRWLGTACSEAGVSESATKKRSRCWSRTLRTKSGRTSF